MKFEIDTLIKMGTCHSLHCDDDYLVTENDDFLLAAVFNGCPDGLDSHYASTRHKYILRDIASHLADSWEFRIKNGVADILRWIVFNTHCKLNNDRYEVGKEMLVGMVACLIDKAGKEYSVITCGDGSFSEGHGIAISMHGVGDGCQPYLSTVQFGWFEEYFDHYCHHFSGKLSDGSEIFLATDGVLSFEDKFGGSGDDYAKKVFFSQTELPVGYRNSTMETLYNAMTGGSLTTSADVPMRNREDLAIIKIKAHDD